MAEQNTWQSWEAVSPPLSGTTSPYTVTMETKTTSSTTGMYSQPPMYTPGPESPSKYVPSQDEFKFITTSSTSDYGKPAGRPGRGGAGGGAGWIATPSACRIPHRPESECCLIRLGHCHCQWQYYGTGMADLITTTCHRLVCSHSTGTVRGGPRIIPCLSEFL